jgi:hypothetical protein
MIKTGKPQYDVNLDYSAYWHLNTVERIRMRKAHKFESVTFKTRDEADAFAEAERTRTGLKISVNECVPLYGIL